MSFCFQFDLSLFMCCDLLYIMYKKFKVIDRYINMSMPCKNKLILDIFVIIIEINWKIIYVSQHFIDF